MLGEPTGRNTLLSQEPEVVRGPQKDEGGRGAPRHVVKKGGPPPQSSPTPIPTGPGLSTGPTSTLTGHGQDHGATRGLPFEPHSDTGYWWTPMSFSVKQERRHLH